MKSNRWTLLLQNQVVAVVLALIMLVPLLFAVPTTSRINQLTAFGFLGLLLFVVWLGRVQDRVTLPKLRSYVTAGPNLPILLYLGWSLVSLLMSKEQFYGQLAFIQLCLGALIYAMVVYQFRRREQVKALLSAVMAIGVIVVLGSLAADRKTQFLDLAGWYHDRQLFGAFLAMLLPVILGVACGTRDRWWRIGAQLAVILVAGALALTRCRSSWLGIAVAGVAFVALSAIYVWKAKAALDKKHELIVGPALVLVALGIFVAFSGASGMISDRFGTLGQLATDASVTDRTALWAIAMKLIANSPLWGCGIGTYALAQAYINPASQNLEVIRQLGPSLHESPHNTYLQIAAEQGLIGLGLYLAVLALFFYTGVQALRRMERGIRKFTLIGCLAAVAGQVVDAISNPGWMYPEVSTFFWLIIGLGMCAAGVGQKVEREEPETGPVKVLGMPLFLYRGVRTAVLACGVLAFAGQILSLNTAGAASAAEGDGRGNVTQAGGRGGRPVYCDFITKIGTDFLNDNITPTQAFEIKAGSVYADRLAVFHFYALTDDVRFYANVTGEGNNLRFKLHGLQGKFYYSASSNNPRYFYQPSPKDKGKTGTIEFSYHCRRPAEVFRGRFTLTVLPNRSPINESVFSSSRPQSSGAEISSFDPSFPAFLMGLQSITPEYLKDKEEEEQQ